MNDTDSSKLYIKLLELFTNIAYKAITETRKYFVSHRQKIQSNNKLATNDYNVLSRSNYRTIIRITTLYVALIL